MEKKVVNKAIVFYILTFVLTILLGAIMMQTNNMLVSPQYAPALALVLICLFKRDWLLFKTINWDMLRNKKWYLWVLISFLIPFLVIYISSLILPSFGLDYSKWTETYSNYAILFISIILGAVFEEIGWRGYLLPLFAKKYNWLTSSIIVGVLWGAWHVSKIANGALVYLLFVILITEFSIVMTWIYRKTKGNIIFMILFHLGINLSSLFFLQDREGTIFYIISVIIMAVISALVVLMNRELFGANKK